MNWMLFANILAGFFVRFGVGYLENVKSGKEKFRVDKALCTAFWGVLTAGIVATEGQDWLVAMGCDPTVFTPLSALFTSASGLGLNFFIEDVLKLKPEGLIGKVLAMIPKGNTPKP